MHFLSTIALLLGAASVQATKVAVPTSPGLTFLYTAFVICDTPIQYEAPNGGRQVIPIVGGNFTGPRVSGTILNLGADWGLVDNNGTFSADTRYGLNTTDGTHLYLRTSGPQQADGDLFLRIKIETSVVSKYAWLNDIIAVGVLKNLGAGPNGKGFTLRIDSWMLGSGK